MSSPRRSFLKSSGILAGVTMLGKPLQALADVSKKINTVDAGKCINIFQTNDMNSQIKSNQDGFGGLEKVLALMANEDVSGLVVDAGNFLDGQQSRERHEKAVGLMNKIGYHAVTIGINELSMGQAGFSELIPQMNFSLVNCNYRFSHSVLSSAIKPYIVIKTKGLKVGVTGVGPRLDIEGVLFENPYTAANRTAEYLKGEVGCDLVICLSQLGFDEDKFSSKELAEVSAHIDFIASGSSNKILQGAMILKNKEKYDVVLSQAGENGMIIGKTRFGFNENKQRIDFHHKYLITGLAHKDQFALAHVVLRNLSAAQKINS
ncbi:hypothetical protein [Pedobacter nutrimenti]|uniref:hypothetical protein n=1 Tax=Pedobacter nutrimenti TaxID=1241337 RepID=UPI00292E9C5F|nr:hypothetical protein [Pedobacter nutrimenti]